MSMYEREGYKELRSLCDVHVSVDGKVLVVRDGVEKYPSVCTSSNGYKVVNIDGKTKLIHRLIGEAYIPNPFNLPIMNHKNGNKQDNALSNLEWCTYHHNNKHAFRVLGRKPSGPWSK